MSCPWIRQATVGAVGHFEGHNWNGRFVGFKDDWAMFVSS
jgi:hypothetical protein